MHDEELIEKDCFLIRRPIITLTTDFGDTESTVAQMKGVIVGINPQVTLIDITHKIPPQDIRRAATILDESFDAFPQSTIHLVVVDPGVGTMRPIVPTRSTAPTRLADFSPETAPAAAARTPTTTASRTSASRTVTATVSRTSSSCSTASSKTAMAMASRTTVTSRAASPTAIWMESWTHAR